MSKKKVVNRTVAIALAAACIVLLASLVGVIAVYNSNANNSNTSDLQSQIASENSTISALQTQITTLQSQLSQISN
jgi:cell division protein FtsL